jgi:hypothetical protein
LAVEEWLTPKGESFWHKGVHPDFLVTLPSEASPLLPGAERAMTAKEFQASEDRQLLEGLKLVSRLIHPANITALPIPMGVRGGAPGPILR